MMRLIRAIQTYAAADDPLVGAANTVALVLAGNQPVYPLYLLGLFGPVALPALVQIALTPAFALIPWLNRRHPLGGRICLVLVGIANTVIYTRLVGQAAGLELFLFPCAMLAAMLFRRSERWIMIALTILPPAVYFLLAPYYGTPLMPFAAADYQTMRTMNTVSVATLIGFFGIVFSGVIAAIETPTDSDPGQRQEMRRR